jgi:UDP-3-O-[3-hydroxymyristoyl] glucosamine N-acyltransferase
MRIDSAQIRSVEVQSTEVAAHLDAEHDGDAVKLTGVDSLGSAGPEQLAFCVYEEPSLVENSNAGVIICLPTVSGAEEQTLIRSLNPRTDFVKIIDNFFRKNPIQTTIHPAAEVSDEADIGNRCLIGPHTYIGPDVSIGDDCTIQSGTSIGGEGFGYFRDESGQLVRQIHQGGVIIEDSVEIGSNCSIDRAVFDDTVVGEGTKMDNLIHIAHNVQIGNDVWIADTVSINGSVKIGDRVRIHPNATIADHSSIGREAEIGMNAGVLGDVKQNTTVVGTPAKPVEGE